MIVWRAKSWLNFAGALTLFRTLELRRFCVSSTTLTKHSFTSTNQFNRLVQEMWPPLPWEAVHSYFKTYKELFHHANFTINIYSFVRLLFSFHLTVPSISYQSITQSFCLANHKNAIWLAYLPNRRLCNGIQFCAFLDFWPKTTTRGQKNLWFRFLIQTSAESPHLKKNES